MLQGKQGRQVLAWLLCQPPLQQYYCNTKPVTARTLSCLCCTFSKLTALLDATCSLHHPTGCQEVNTDKHCAVAEEHACIEVKKGRLYCTALVGDPENFMDETFTWLNESELRPGQFHNADLCPNDCQLVKLWLDCVEQCIATKCHAAKLHVGNHRYLHIMMH